MEDTPSYPHEKMNKKWIGMRICCIPKGIPLEELEEQAAPHVGGVDCVTEASYPHASAFDSGQSQMFQGVFTQWAIQ